ncbi:enoyl-CoA hydratase [Dasania marina]|uniref:enoyl-CoA hydratase n=1 Tax=Dasania marina TaxID=471499 RepID=UPI0030D8F9C3|tara:strand:- start:42102 stop:42872 length:771 start_codon:yes stop_codon:yes gene_type:complete
MADTIIAELNNSVLQLTINRPERKNAFTQAMYASLAEHLQQAAHNDAVRVVLLTGSAGLFTSGNDLEDFKKAPADLTATNNPTVAFMMALAHCPKPVVAAVEGVAVGIGTTLLLHCDLVYAHPETRFCMPFVNLGLSPEYGSSLLLPRLAGNVKAAELLMLGEMFSAADAKEAMLINAVVDTPLAVARAQCVKLSQKPPAALRHSKALLKAALQPALDKVIAEELLVFSKGLQGEEFKEAVNAFFEKRPADFSRFN